MVSECSAQRRLECERKLVRELRNSKQCRRSKHLLASLVSFRLTSHLLYNKYLFWTSVRRLRSLYIYIKVKCSRYRPGVAQGVGTGIALLFHDRGTRRRWVVSSTHRPHFTPGKDPVPILQEAGWAPGPVWKGEKSHPYRDSIPDRPARS